MRNMNVRRGDEVPCGMSSRALSGKPSPERPKISREMLSGRAQLLVSRAGSLMKKESGGKLSDEGEKMASELGRLLGEHGNELSGIGIVKDGEKIDAYQAILMSRAELLSLKDGGCTGGC